MNKTLEKSGDSQKHTPIRIPWKHLIPFFPFVGEESLSKIQMTKEGLYSSSVYIHSEFIRDLIKLFYTPACCPKVSITDATACLGGTILASVPHFGTINAVELNPQHSEMARHNLEAIFPKLSKKVNIINDNYLTVWNSLPQKTNVTIIDPPWGGMNYAKRKTLKLFLTDKKGSPHELVDIINMVLPSVDLVIARIPFNYDRRRLKNIPCKFSSIVKFLKRTHARDKKTGLPRYKISYYMCMFSNIKPLIPVNFLNPEDYAIDISYRKIPFEELELIPQI